MVLNDICLQCFITLNELNCISFTVQHLDPLLSKCFYEELTIFVGGMKRLFKKPERTSRLPAALTDSMGGCDDS